MSVSDDFLGYVLEQLEGIPRIRRKRMFGAVGLYSEEIFFAIVDDDVLYLKADEETSADYIARAMPRFMPDSTRPDATLGYYEVPPEIIEDREALAIWARKSVAVGMRKASRPKRKAPRKRN